MTETTRAESSGEPLVEVEGLQKHYGPIRAVDGISFTLRRGDVLGFLGPNGAGKTTAMRLVTGFLDPDAGRVTIGGHDLATEALAARQMMGYLPENAPAYGEMTARSFLDFVARARGIENPAAALDRVVEMTALSGVLHQPVETLSKGFKRRVGLAQALIHDPEVLILDEPTDGLDPNQKQLVQELIASLSASKCIILSTHILDEVERICNRAMIISGGRILVDATPHELIARASSHNVVRVTLAGESDGLIERLEGASWCDRVVASTPTDLEIVPADGGNHLAEVIEMLHGSEVAGIQLCEGRLDEVFREMTRGVAA